MSGIRRVPPAPSHRERSGDPRRPSVGSGGVEQTLREHHSLMLRRARRVSLCDDDAHDAVQAASERYLRHHPRVDPETTVGWLVTVTRNEALRIRQVRTRNTATGVDEEQLPQPGDGPAELAEREEQVELAREALAALKPQERQALMLQAEGHSYDEIAGQLAWTRTKVNRSLTEGRAHLRDRLRGIAAGEGCAAAKPRIDRLVRGDASRDDLLALRPHLRRCTSCRSRLRRARGSHWVAVPPVLLGWLPWVGRLGGAPPTRARVGNLVADRLAVLLPGSGAVADAGLAVAAGVAATALAAGTLVVGSREPPDRPRPVTPATSLRAAADPGLLVARDPTRFRAPATRSTAGGERRSTASAAAGPTTPISDRRTRRALSTAPAGATAQREFGPESAPPADRSGAAGPPVARAPVARPAAGKAADSRGSAAREFGIEP